MSSGGYNIAINGPIPNLPGLLIDVEVAKFTVSREKNTGNINGPSRNLLKQWATLKRLLLSRNFDFGYAKT